MMHVALFIAILNQCKPLNLKLNRRFLKIFESNLRSSCYNTPKVLGCNNYELKLKIGNEMHKFVMLEVHMKYYCQTYRTGCAKTIPSTAYNTPSSRNMGSAYFHIEDDRYLKNETKFT